MEREENEKVHVSRKPTDGCRVAGQTTRIAETQNPGQRSLQPADQLLQFREAREIDHG